MRAYMVQRLAPDEGNQRTRPDAAERPPYIDINRFRCPIETSEPRVITLQTIQLLILAALAAVVLFNLYAVLGKRVGRQPEDLAPAGLLRRATEAVAAPTDAADGVALSGLAAVKAKDPGFEIDAFLRGARTAHDTIVKAFAANDRDALKPLTDPGVFATFEAAIGEREKAGIAEKVEFVGPARADLDLAEVEGDRVRMKVRFLSEFRTSPLAAAGSGDTPAPAEERRAAELWTFERPAASRDANWTLARVEPAEA